MSQADLAARLGVTFQQLQKYEQGANRISASKLFLAATALRAPTDWFFEGLRTEGGAPAKPACADLAADEFLSSWESFELARLLPRLPAAQRRQLLQLVHAIATTPEGAQCGGDSAYTIGSKPGSASDTAPLALPVGYELG